MGIQMQALRWSRSREEQQEKTLGTVAEASAVPSRRKARTRSTAIAQVMVLVAAFFAATTSAAWAQGSGDPLFCQPNEGVEFLIINGGSGVFTVYINCYGGNFANNVTNSITTSQGGTLTRSGSTGNYTYAPPTLTFTGTDTFLLPVTTVRNSAGGTGSAGGSSPPGGPTTLTITLNVIPSTTTLSVPGVATLVPVPAGSITGCTVGGNPATGPAAGTTHGCVTGLVRSGTPPSHGTLKNSGNTLEYTPEAGYTGSDTFSYQALGTNTDGASALRSGSVTVQVSITAAAVPALGTWAMALLCGFLLLSGVRALARRAA